MLASLRRSYADLITSGAQLVLLAVGSELESRLGWQVSLGAMAALSLFAWYSSLHRLRIITGTPTSRIASAAQGYVELLGQGRFHETQLVSKLSALPCLWFRYLIEEKSGSKNQWRTVERGESSEPFLLDDGSGLCIVDPAQAEIVTKHRDVWHEGRYRYTEWKLLGSDALYALGHFKTVGGSSSPLTHGELVKQVLAEWKLNHADLLKRFDLDGNGLLDMQEWMLARQAAKREAEKRLSVARNQADINFLVQPPDGKLFLISNYTPDKLARRYLFWAWAHIAILFAALGGFIWVSSWPAE